MGPPRPRTVRYHDGIRTLQDEGVRTFVEVGPQAVLAGLGCGENGVFVASQRRDRPSRPARHRARRAAHPWCHRRLGSVLRRSRRAHRRLPTYAFQHKLLARAPDAVADVSRRGWSRQGTPRTCRRALGRLRAGDPDRATFAQCPPLAGRSRRGGTVLFPGTGFVELAIRAGDEAGFPVLDDLTLEEPLVLSEDTGAILQVITRCEPHPRQRARRPRRCGSWRSTPFRRSRRRSVLDPPRLRSAAARCRRCPRDSRALAEWPPAEAEPLPVDDAYSLSLPTDCATGRVPGLRAAWRRGDELFAEVVLPEHVAEKAEEFGLHPALLDAALHRWRWTPPPVTRTVATVVHGCRSRGAG
ncbi:hypothetical protein D3C59_35695 [Streptomyces sp. SHP22-7]|nr:hypothetical protein D3C59_35695 [Streptomyces sp. SHP22-7]